MADLGKNGEKNQKQKGDGRDFFGSAGEGVGGPTENAEVAQQADRLEEEEEEAESQ